jgi:hypothetical protein
VVNTASRLQGVAPVGGVVVGEQTFRATERVFDYEALEPVTVKGKALPVPLWRATAARARFGTDLIRSLTTPLVGRDLERGLLTGTFERSVRDSTVQLVTIVGEPGVGKSRLVAELSSFVDDRPELVRWRQGRCLPYGDGITFWALGEIVKAETGILETDSPEVAAAKIDAVVPDEDADAPWLRQRLRSLVGLEAPQAAREENFAAWRRFLESVAEAGPSVFVFEDLHWADDALLAFLEHLADYSEGVPMLLVATARPELYERAPAWAASARDANRINLAPLSETETARLISNLLESAVLPVEVQSAILHRSGGNPLYAEEFVRLLKDRGILTKQGSTWTLDPDAEIPMPSGVQGLIAARLDTLSPEHKHLLQDAAVVGKVFWSGAVAKMGQRDPKEISEALHELSRKELIRPARASSMAGEAEYAFYHALVRDVCYAQIPRASGPSVTCGPSHGSRRSPRSGWRTTLRSWPPTTRWRWGWPRRPRTPARSRCRPRPCASSPWPGTGPWGSTWRPPSATTPGRLSSPRGMTPTAPAFFCEAARPSSSGAGSRRPPGPSRKPSRASGPREMCERWPWRWGDTRSSYPGWATPGIGTSRGRPWGHSSRSAPRPSSPRP